MVVSRWFVMPIAAISSAEAPIFCIASCATKYWVDQISFASCSTQPGLGKIWVNSFCATLHISPALLKRMQRLLVVPASRAMIYFAIFSSCPRNFRILCAVSLPTKRSCRIRAESIVRMCYTQYGIMPLYGDSLSRLL